MVLCIRWRVKDAKKNPGEGPNRCPDYQQLLTQCDLVIWLDSTGERRIAEGLPTLESRVRTALDPATRGRIERSGGLSPGESTHQVNDVSLFDPENAPGVASKSRGTEFGKDDDGDDIPVPFHGRCFLS